MWKLETNNRQSININQQSGHVITEWLVVTLLITMALFAPIPGTDQSAVAVLMEAIRDFHESNSYLLSLP
jgi:hypothetical protein